VETVPDRGRDPPRHGAVTSVGGIMRGLDPEAGASRRRAIRPTIAPPGSGLAAMSCGDIRNGGERCRRLPPAARGALILRGMAVMSKLAGQQDGDRQQLKLICMDNLLAAAVERVYFKDTLSRFLFVSAGWIAAYAPDRTAEWLTGKTDFDVFSYDHAFTARKDEQQIMQTGQPIVGKLERETYLGRAEAWVSTTKMPLRDERGRVIGTFGVSRDVTAQIMAENALSPG
jgi:PAS domain-containing protein